MKRKAAAVATSIALLASIAATPAAAQNNLNDPLNDSAVNNTAPGATTEDRTGGFEWWWLLPLLAIPLFFVFRNEERGDETREYRDRSLAGTRGGEASRDREELDEEYVDEEKEKVL